MDLELGLNFQVKAKPAALLESVKGTPTMTTLADSSDELNRIFTIEAWISMPCHEKKRLVVSHSKIRFPLTLKLLLARIIEV